MNYPFKKYSRIVLYIHILVFVASVGRSSTLTDSLKRELSNAKSDSARLVYLDRLAWNVSYENLDSGLIYAKQTLFLAIKQQNHFATAKAYNTIGTIYVDMGKFKEATEAFDAAIDYYEKNGSKRGIGLVYANMANIEQRLAHLDKMLFYLQKSYAILKQENDLRGMAGVAHNLGAYYVENNKIDSARHYVSISLKISEEKEWEHYIANNLALLGQLENMEGHPDKAKIYFNQAIELFSEMESYYDICHVLLTQSSFLIKNRKFTEAIELLQKAKRYAQEIGLRDDIRAIHEHLSECYEALGDYSRALLHFKNASFLKDSIRNNENIRQMNELVAKMDAKEKEKQIELLKKNESINELENQRQKDALAKQNLFLTIAIGFSGLFIVLAFILYRGNRNKRRANMQLSQQKEIIEEKNKEIVDSINYAKRLQDAILPSTQKFKSTFSDAAILYLPKDIVAGDFYFHEQIGDYLFFAACDCTGHGVPGAMVSVVCANALHRSVKEFRLTDPGKILDKVRELVIETFDKNENEVRDGMDISLCVYNTKNKQLTWAGAHNPLWIIHPQKEIMEIKGDKQPIGKFDSAKNFTTHRVETSENDYLVLLTDGYSDQFGGVKGKKLKDAQLKSMLLNEIGHTADQIKSKLLSFFQQWKSDLEQVDDVCILIVKL